MEFPKRKNYRERNYRKMRDRSEEENESSSSKKSRSGRDSDRDRERERSSMHMSRERDSERDKDNDKRRERDMDKDKVRERDREKERRDRDREKENERDRDYDRDREREQEKEKERRSPCSLDRERESRKEAVEPETDLERGQKTVLVYQIPMRASENDVHKLFSEAGEVRDVRLVEGQKGKSRGVGYVEFHDAESVPRALHLSGRILRGQPVMVKPSEAERNVKQSNAAAGGSVTGPRMAIDRMLHVEKFHFSMSEPQLKQIFDSFGHVELVKIPTIPETGHGRGFGFVQFAQPEHAKEAARKLNENHLLIEGEIIKVSPVTERDRARYFGT